MRSMSRLHNGQQVNHEYQHMTLGINMLTSIFFLHTNMEIIISSTPMYYAKYHVVNSYALQKVNYVDKQCLVGN